MSTRIETLGTRKQVPARTVVMLAIAAVLAVGVAVAGFALVDRSTTVATKPAGITDTAVQPAAEVPVLVKGGLQPRPFSRIPTPERASISRAVPAGFVPVGTSGDFRPRPDWTAEG